MAYCVVEGLVFGQLVAAPVDGVIVTVDILTVFIPQSESDE